MLKRNRLVAGSGWHHPIADQRPTIDPPASDNRDVFQIDTRDQTIFPVTVPKRGKLFCVFSSALRFVEGTHLRRHRLHDRSRGELQCNSTLQPNGRGQVNSRWKINDTAATL